MIKGRMRSAVSHPPADGVEGDGDPSRERRQQRHLTGRSNPGRVMGPNAAQSGIGEGIQKQSAQRQPPDKAGNTANRYKRATSSMPRIYGR